ncbi:MAG: hypothetical protein DI562_03465 [Stenotrophomonas acidaminiphila]|uniref:hypothetical protein n=1 Tax=Pseudoxanthomonas TaxID=83618 RepID=UPI000DB23CB8|nr:hypothetical protein [Pseudoxanthomonas mexicana]PZQ32476.1 MAG: hypothetical protein DI562_03465 [Stenotrophomonas acidaminiphila]
MGKRLTLKTTPPERLDLASWVMPSLEGLDSAQQKRFYSLKDAITSYVGGERITPLLQQLSIWKEVFYRAYDKCVALDERGRPIGWVGLLPNLEMQPRQRRKPLPQHQCKGLAGALGLFLSQNGEIAEALNNYLLLNAKRKPGGEAGIRHKSVHMEFLRLCKAKDPDEQSWPFKSRRRGAGAVRKFTNTFLISHYDAIVATQYGDKAATKSKAGNGHVSRLTACMPMDIVEIDEHAMGCIGTVRIQTPEGSRFLDAGRMKLLLLADRHKGWIMAFKVIFREEANAGDAMDVLHAGMVGEPDWAHRAEDQRPTRPLADLDDRFGWCGFNCLLLDNALIHLAEELVSRVMALSGCAMNFGPVKTPARRQLVERIFNELERAGFKRLPQTTGAGPLDPKRQNAEAAARACVVSEREIVGLVVNLVRKFNEKAGKANLAASPAQRMHALICGPERDQYLFPFLPPLREGEADLSKSIAQAKIRGNKSTGRRPYFTFLDVDYTNPGMSKDWALLGQTADLHVVRTNVRYVDAFHQGRPVGTCQAGGRWRWSDHSIDLRRHINQLLREGYIDNDRNDDVVAAFLQKVAADNAKVKEKGKSKPSKADVRQMGDHNARRDIPNDVATTTTQEREAEAAVNELLDRASESSSSNYLPWDDIGALNGDRNDY